jgi:TrfA protein
MHTLPDIVGGAEPCLVSAPADNFLKNRYPKVFAKAEAAKRSAAFTTSVANQTGTRADLLLPQWPELARGVPNGVLRSALFGAIKKGARRFMDGEKVAALDGIEIRYTGQQLDQGDLDAWENVLHIVRFQQMGERCRFTAYSMLKLLGKTDAGSNRSTLHKRLIRLKANAIEVHQGGRYSYAGSLIDEVYRDTETHEYVLILNPNLRALFGTDQFTQVDWSVRRLLSGKPLAQWLHGYYSSHAKPYPLNLSTLIKLSGSRNADASSAGQTMRKALDALTSASESNGQPFKYEIRGDLVHVEKLASRSQNRHLAKYRKPLQYRTSA